MKHFILITMVVISTIIIYSCENSNASMAKGNGNYEKLKEMGFNSEPNVVKSVKEQFYSKYGVEYISDGEMDSIISKDTLIWAQASKFKTKIPDAMASKIVSNYKKVEDIRHYEWMNFWWPTDNSAADDKIGIFVIAPQEDFTADAKIKKDPIVAIKIDGGWLVLAKWQ